MVQKCKKRGLRRAIFVAAMIAVSPLVWADDAVSPPNPTKTPPANTINLARLAAVLQAATDRKQAGDEVILKKDAYIHGRPTGDATKGSVLPAGTVLRKSKRQIVNATGSWRHIETRDGINGWMYELDLDP